MDAVSLRDLYDHHAWAMDRVLARAAEVPREQAAKPWGAAGGLTAILDHILSAERAWLTRFQARSRVAWVDAETVADVQRRWVVLQAEGRAYLAGLEPADLPRYPHPRDRRTLGWGDPHDRRTLGAAITHVLMHGAQHTAEAAELLTQLGHSPGQLDYLEFLDIRERTFPLLPPGRQG